MKQVCLAILAAFTLALVCAMPAHTEGGYAVGIDENGNYAFQKLDGQPQVEVDSTATTTPKEGVTVVVNLKQTFGAQTPQPQPKPKPQPVRSTTLPQPQNTPAAGNYATQSEVKSLRGTIATGDANTVKSIKGWAEPQFKTLNDGLAAANESCSAVNTQIGVLRRETEESIKSIRTDLKTLSENDGELVNSLAAFKKQLSVNTIAAFLALAIALITLLAMIARTRGNREPRPRPIVPDRPNDRRPDIAEEEAPPADEPIPPAEAEEETDEEFEARMRREAGLDAPHEGGAA